MSTIKMSGFTIIEVMLFLAISGLLTVALLGGWSLSVNTQSYKDSVRSVADDIRSEFNAVYNINNDRGNNYSCDTSANVTPVETGGSERGTSNCIIMGRFVSVRGMTINSQAVVGLSESKSVSATAEAEDIFKGNSPKIAAQPIDTNEFSVPWSSKLVKPGDGDDNQTNFDMLIIRSPVDGTVSTYVHDYNGTEQAAEDLINRTNKTEKTACIEPSGPVAQGRLGIKIASNATTAAAVTIIGDTEDICK